MKKIFMVAIALIALSSCRKQKALPPKEEAPVLVDQKTFSVTQPFNHTFAGLDPKATYYLQVEGTYSFGGGHAFDASYGIAAQQYYRGEAYCRTKWQLNSNCDIKPVPFQYQPSHVYRYNLPANASLFTVSFHDCLIPPSTSCAYGDNNGSLTFKVFKGTLK